MSGAATRIRSHEPWWRVGWHELWEYRDLFVLLVRRDLTVVYKQSILGPLWFVLQPLLSTVVFTLIFSNMAKLSTDSIPPFIFYMSGAVLWSYFAGCMNSVATSLSTNAHLFSKVYFPRLLMPFALTTSNMAQLLLNLTIFAGFWGYGLASGAPIHPRPGALLLPLLMLQCGVVGLGSGLWLSAMTVKYRDLRFALGFLSQLWMFATPVVYPTSVVGERYAWVLALNPMAGPVDFFRASFLGTPPMRPGLYLSGLAIGVVVFVTGLFLFNKIQRSFVDTI
jgi:lipopolysaccharide transport system permease protein